MDKSNVIHGDVSDLSITCDPKTVLYIYIVDVCESPVLLLDKLCQSVLLSPVSVCPSVCLCLFVTRACLHDNFRTNRARNFKFNMYGINKHYGKSLDEFDDGYG